MWSKTTKRNIALMLFSALFFSCEDPVGILIGTNNGIISTYFTDTLKVSTSTIMFDSTFTSGQSSGLVGRYKDPVFGEVSAKSFAQLTLPIISTSTGPAFTPLVFPDADKGSTVYDSVYVYVTHDGFIHGDTTKPFSLSVHRLNENFTTGKKYTKDDALSYDTTPLATKTFTFKELKRAQSTTSDSLLAFKLPNTIGKELYDLVGTDAATTNDKFTAAVKGLAFTSSLSAENLYSISVMGSYLQIFYHTTGSTTRKGLSVTLFSQNFSQIKGDKKGTVLQNLQVLQSIPANQTNNRTYLQTGLGISPKILFPNLEALKKNKSLIINKAELVIEPDLDQITGRFKTPTSISLVQLEKTNRMKKTSAGLIDFIALDGISGTQYIAGYNATNNTYSFNFTSFLQDLLNGTQNTDGIAIVPSLLNSSAGTIAVYNNNTSRMVVKNIKMNIYYSTK